MPNQPLSAPQIRGRLSATTEDADTAYSFGRAVLGGFSSDVAGLRHTDATQRAVTQTSAGATTIDNNSGQTGNLAVNGTSVLGWSASGVSLTNIIAKTSAGLALKNSGGTTVATLGAGGGTDTTFAGGVNMQALGATTGTFTGNISTTLGDLITQHHTLDGGVSTTYLDLKSSSASAAGLLFRDSGSTLMTRILVAPDSFSFRTAADAELLAIGAAGATLPSGRDLTLAGGDLSVTGAGSFTGSLQVAPTSGAGQIQVRGASGNNMRMTWTETGVADRASMGFVGGDGTLYCSLGASNVTSGNWHWKLTTSAFTIASGVSLSTSEKITAAASVPGSFADLAAVQSFLASIFN